MVSLLFIVSLLFLKNYTAATFNDNETLLSPILLESAINPSPSVSRYHVPSVTALSLDILRHVASDLALPHYDTRDVLAITNLPYMVVSHDLGQCAFALSQLENALRAFSSP